MAEFTPYIYKIQRYAIHDGPGIRTTLFFQGCPLSCWWCHNPESQAMGPSCIPEKEIVAALVQEIEKDRIFYDESNGGVTFSGGEPLSRPELLIRLVAACRGQGIHTCLDTSGFALFELLKAVATKVDLVLYDIKILDDQDHRKFTGKSVKPILDNLKKLSALRVNLRLRFPLIPSMTDTDENINRIIEFLTRETRYREIHILPFHATGAGKYARLNLENNLKNINPPPLARVEEVCQAFEADGFRTTIGG